MPKQTTDHCPVNDKVLETKEDSTVAYISCEKALAILKTKWQATKEELAAWFFLGPEQGGLAAFLDAYQITPPRQFFYPYCAGRKDYLWPLSLWWFRQNDIEQFVPADRYITGASLIERWSTLESSLPEDYIIARVRESRLVDMHPTFGGTQATFENPLPGLSYPPVETGLFSIKQIEALEVEEGITPSTDKRHDKTPHPVAATPTAAPPPPDHQEDQQPALRRGEKVYPGQKKITEAFNKHSGKKAIGWPAIRLKREQGLNIVYKPHGKKPVPILDHYDLLDFLEHIPR